MVRRGFTLVEVIVSLTLLATALLGLAAAASIAHHALRSAEREERTVRHAAALIDSLTFSGAAAAAGVRVRDGVVLRWEIASGPGGEARLEATYDAAAAPVTLTFRTRRVPGLALRRP